MGTLSFFSSAPVTSGGTGLDVSQTCAAVISVVCWISLVDDVDGGVIPLSGRESVVWTSSFAISVFEG